MDHGTSDNGTAMQLAREMNSTEVLNVDGVSPTCSARQALVEGLSVEGVFDADQASEKAIIVETIELTSATSTKVMVRVETNEPSSTRDGAA